MTAQPPSAGEPAELSERTLRAWHRIGFGLQPDARHTPMSACRLTGNGQIQLLPDRAEAFFAAGGDSHRMSFLLPVPLLSNGLSVRIRLRGWGSIRYVACGYSCDGLFRHIKVPNPAQARWFDITIGHGDIGFGLQNNWEHPASAMIGDIRIDVRGEPLIGGARIEVQGLLCCCPLGAPGRLKGQAGHLRHCRRVLQRHGRAAQLRHQPVDVAGLRAKGGKGM